MTTTTDFNPTSSSSYTLSFYSDKGDTKWMQNGKTMPESLCKEALPQNSLFNISSLVFNIQTRKEEALNHYSCFYQPSLDALCLVFERTADSNSFSRDAMLNMMALAKQMSIKSIVLLINRKSADYAKLIQGMMVVGFAPEKNKKMATIDGQSYKILSMNMKEQLETIEEVAF